MMLKNFIFGLAAFTASAVMADGEAGKLDAGCKPCPTPCPQRCPQTTALTAGSILLGDLEQAINTGDVPSLIALSTGQSWFAANFTEDATCNNFGPTPFLQGILTYISTMYFGDIIVDGDSYVNNNGDVILYTNQVIYLVESPLNFQCKYVMRPTVRSGCEFKIHSMECFQDLCNPLLSTPF